MSLDIWLAFVVTSIILLVIPGPTILAVISYSVSHGRKANIPLVAAVTMGDSTTLFASLVGLGALLSASVFWFSVVKIVGGLYLVFLGLKMLFSMSPRQSVTTDINNRNSALKLFFNTWLVTALNPKSIVFFIAFLPQFVISGENIQAQLFILGSTFVFLAGLNATLYAYFASAISNLLESEKAQRVYNLLGGAILTGAGVWAILVRKPA